MSENEMQFTRAVQTRGKARVALIGPSGSGKTYTALNIGQHLGRRVALIDTEHGSASKYARRFVFDTLELTSFDPRRFVQAIDAAGKAGYDVLLVDSLSHEWSGKDGALQLVDKVAAQNQSANKFTAWNSVTPLHDAVFEAILRSPCHVIGTMRGKTEYVIETDQRGKQAPRKIGMGAIQRDGVEYEFDVVGDLSMDHNLVITKTRCEELDGEVIARPGKEVADRLLAWLSQGEGEPTRSQPPNNGASSAKPSKEDRDAYARRMHRATELGIDLAAFEADERIARADLIALSRKLADAIKAKEAEAATEQTALPA